MNSKILHLATDDKFIDMAYPYFEKLAPESNDVYVYSKLSSLIYVKCPCEVFNNIPSLFKSIQWSQYDKVIFHSLPSAYYPFLFLIPKDIPILWIGWGYDYYNSLIKKDLVLPETYKLSKQKAYTVKNLLRKTIIKLAKSFLLKKVVARINYFSPVLINEYEEIITEYNYRKFPIYIKFNYGSLEKNFIKGFEEQLVNGNNVLVGNSATPTNNHIEAFEFIKGIDGSHKIICPLSYGDEAYKNLIFNIGKKEFQENFIPLIEFMPMRDYVEMIISCKYVIMNHVRQQALGNIITMMYLGALIFLREDNPIYSFFKKEGAYIYNIETLSNKSIFSFPDLSTEQVETNRQILRSHFSEKIINNNILSILKNIKKQEL